MRTGFLFAGLAGLVAAVGASDAASAGNWTSSINSTSLSDSTNSTIPTLNATNHSFDSTYKHFECGVTAGEGSTSFNQTIRLLHLGKRPPLAGSLRPSLEIRANTLVTVPTVFHIVTKSDAASKASITQKMVDAQIATLNTVYNAYNIKFNLINTTWTHNDAWAVGGGSDGEAMKKALRQGTYSTLNIYFQTDLYGSILGTCSLPSEIGPAPVEPSVYFADGCNVQAGTMPGGKILGYSAGKTAVHETGHWLGLLHTFEGYSCTGNGDFISDTPMQSTSTDGCPTKPAKDSCPGVVGVDPIHNYMDYSTDACYTNFTPKQKERILTMWAAYRQGR